jgi:hypothetical protein
MFMPSLENPSGKVAITPADNKAFTKVLTVVCLVKNTARKPDSKAKIIP